MVSRGQRPTIRKTNRCNEDTATIHLQHPDPADGESAGPRRSIQSSGAAQSLD